MRTGEDLDQQGRYTTRQILEDIPGIFAVDNSNTRNQGTGDNQGNNITIRGIAAQNSAAGGVSGISAAAGAAVYVDGVYEGIGSGYDIQRVEVLRGPQGTLYGRSATTGVVAFHTRNPTMTGISGEATAEIGNYDLRHYSGGLNVPLTDRLAVRVSGDYFKQGEGFYQEAVRGQAERKNARVKVLWKPTDALSILVGGAYEKRDSFGGGNSYFVNVTDLNAITTQTALLVPGKKESKQVWAEVNWDMGPVTLTYLPAFRDWKQDDTSIAVNALRSGANRRTTQLTPKNEFHTQELRLSSSSESAIRWQTGVYYYHNDLINNVLAQYETPEGVKGAITSESRDFKDTRNIGFFAETTIPINEALRVTLGARYDDTKIVVSEYLYDNDFQNCGNGLGLRIPLLPVGQSCTGPGTATVPSRPAVNLAGETVKYSWFSYKGRVEYDLSPDNMVYGMISTAYRPGDAGIRNRVVVRLDKEKLTAMEIGSKNRFLSNSLQVNASAFYYDYKSFVVLYQPDIFIPGAFIDAQVPARNYGAELEILYRLSPHDRLGINASYVRSEWRDKPPGFDAAFPLKKRAMIPWIIAANYQHNFDMPGGSTLSTRIDGRLEGPYQFRDLQAQYYTSFAGNSRVEGFNRYEYRNTRFVGNLSAIWTSPNSPLSFSAYVRNFTNKQYRNYTVSTDATRLTLDWSDPRQYGVQIGVRF